MQKEKPWLSKSEQQKLDSLVQREGVEDYNYQKAEKEDVEYETSLGLPNGLFHVEKISASTDLQEAVYYAYARAISRRDRTPLDEDRFNYHFFEGGNFDKSVAFGDERRGFLLGSQNNDLGIFTPTHFAPFSLKAGYELFQKLGKSNNIPAVLAITPDLENTLLKMPCWHSLELPVSLPASFYTGESIEKRLMYNDYFTTPEGQALAMQAVAHFVVQYDQSENEDNAENSSNREEDPEFESIREKIRELI